MINVQPVFYRFFLTHIETTSDCFGLRTILEYRMTAHVYRNKPSTAVATCRLIKAVETSEQDIKYS